MADGEPAQAMIDWINGAPPAELAVEVMAVFGPDGPRGGSTSRQSIHQFIDWMFRGYPSPGLFRSYPVSEPMLEAVQLLEHAELVYVTDIHDIGDRYWRATRLGLGTLLNGKAAVRQRIMDRTGL